MIPGRIYTAYIDAQGVTAELDFFEILCPANSVIEVLEIDIGQETEEGDTQAEQLSYKLVRGTGTVTSGSGGGTVTPEPHQTGFGAANAVVETLNTTKMAVGTGALHILHASAFHVAAGIQWVPTPDCRFVLSPGERGTVELAEAPADSITFSGTLKFKEIGG